MRALRSDERGLVLVDAHAVAAVLDDRCHDVVSTVEAAYLAFAGGRAALPHSVFLPFGADRPERIIGLPARLDEPEPLAGIKWVSSFPRNVDLGMDRASAVIVMNSVETGRANALIEGSHISASRTAGMSALAIRALHGGRTDEMGFVGAGPINYELARFCVAEHQLTRAHVFDIDRDRAVAFGRRAERELGLDARVLDNVQPVLAATPIVAFATSAVSPYVDELAGVLDGATILHTSLRDLTPRVLADVDNIVDDADHVCRASTSAHLAEQTLGDRSFIRGSLADVLQGQLTPRRSPDRAVVFSPFGLGVLDLALADFVLREAIAAGLARTVDDFFGPSWSGQARA